jgi:hypothetical protein
MGSVRLIEKEAAAWKETAVWKEAVKWTENATWKGNATETETETVIVTGTGTETETETETETVFRSRVVLLKTAGLPAGVRPYFSRRFRPFFRLSATSDAVSSVIHSYGSGTETASGFSRSM